MAKKKSTGSINLLKGIQGSKLAALVTVLVILFAIPLTVVVTRQQQQTKQEAATYKVPCPDKYGNAYGNCYDKNIYSCSTGFISKQCYGKSNIQCCQGKVTKKSTGQSCANEGGTCQPTCKGTYKTGLCPEGSICCLYSGVDRCRNDYPKGKCIYDSQPCKGSRVSDLCPGPSNYRCCTKI
ncbi:MAG: hypothetical protein A2152_00725 [Candidatus Levybacteria bacterium RBG_16_35_6]|nr:MAG: hypothetical protein A2152_00725 [Candidatus Levybacteria bacterium RBG_16_35_6]